MLSPHKEKPKEAALPMKEKEAEKKEKDEKKMERKRTEEKKEEQKKAAEAARKQFEEVERKKQEEEEEKEIKRSEDQDFFAPKKGLSVAIHQPIFSQEEEVVQDAMDIPEEDMEATKKMEVEEAKPEEEEEVEEETVRVVLKPQPIAAPTSNPQKKRKLNHGATLSPIAGSPQVLASVPSG